MDVQTEPYRTLVLLEESLWRAETRGDRALMDTPLLMTSSSSAA